MATMIKIRSILKSFKDDESASATIEFVMLIPIVIWIVFSVLEAGWLMTQKTMLNRGVNMAVRDLRIGATPNPTHATIKTDICNYAGILRNCQTALHLEMVGFDNPISSAAATCVDRSTAVEPVVNWLLGSRTVPEVMILRACFVVDPLIPGAGMGALLPTDSTGAFHMVSYSSFVNEPL